MTNFAKVIISLGLLLISLGIILLLASKFKLPFLGKLPGDILIERKNFSFYFPLTTCLVISIVLSLIIYFFSKK